RQREIVRRHEPLGARLFGSRWQGERSHWAALANLTRWTWQLHHDVRARRLPREIIAFLAENPPVGLIGPPAQVLKEALAAYLDRLEALVRFLEYDAGTRSGSGSGPGATLVDLAFDALEALLRTWSERPGDLFALAGFNHLSRRCRDDALG